MINDKLIKKVFYSYLAISILSSLTATIGARVDGIVIGQVLGPVCVSAFGISSPVVILTAAIAGIFSNGGSELVQVFLVGLPSALNRACMSIRGISLNHLLMVLGGTMAVSALAVQNNINQIFSSITMGVGMTAMMLTGVFYGEKDDRALEKTLRVSLKSGVFLSGVTAVAVIISARPLVRLFLEGSEEGMVLAVRSLRFFCLSLPLPLICVVLINFYQCTKNLLLANVICIGHGLAFVVAVSFAMAPVLGMDAVWISFFCSEVLTLLTVLLIIRVKSGRWPKNWSDLALLPEDFRPSQERILDITIKNDMEQVMELSSRIHEFCGKYTMDSKKVGKLALCIEEMAGNIVQHGFKDEKMHSIDIRIIMSEETIFFRMRDDGIAFNPIPYADENFLSQEENIGIKLVQKIAKEMSYNNAIGMNNLTIVI